MLHVTAPEQIEDQPHHRNRQQQNDPGEAIHRIATAIVNVDRGRQTGDLERCIDNRGTLFQKICEKDNDRDLQRKEHHDHRDAQYCRNAALPSLLHAVALHAHSPFLTRICSRFRAAGSA